MQTSIGTTAPAPQLSPEQFAGAGGGQPPILQATVVPTAENNFPSERLSVGDRGTLEQALAAIKSARKDVANTDPKTARAARMRLVSLISYLTGFFDSRWTGLSVPVSPGFDGLAGASGRPTLDHALDEFEDALATMLAESETRSLRQTAGIVLSTLGDVGIAIGTGMIVGSLVL